MEATPISFPVGRWCACCHDDGVVIFWKLSDSMSLFLPVHFDLQASMRLLLMDYQSVTALKMKSVTFVLLSMLLSESG